jgi:hypothetical protein
MLSMIPCIAAKSLTEPPEACRPQEGLKSKAPKHPEVLGRAIRHAPHREAFIPDAKSFVSRTGWQGYNRTPTSGGHAFQGAQLGWQSRRHTEVLQDPSMKAPRPQGGRFGVQTTSIAANNPAEPLYQGIGNLSDRHTDHGGLTKS